jgi:hypothetical protein
MTKGEEITSRALMIPFFWRFMPKRGRNEPKAKGPPHHHQIQKLSVFQKYLSIDILLCSKGGFRTILHQNPLEH